MSKNIIEYGNLLGRWEGAQLPIFMDDLNDLML